MACRIGGKEYEYRNIIMFIIPTIIMTIICAIFYFIPQIPLLIRWLVAAFVGIIILRDFFKYKSIF